MMYRKKKENDTSDESPPPPQQQHQYHARVSTIMPTPMTSNVVSSTKDQVCHIPLCDHYAMVSSSSSSTVRHPCGQCRNCEISASSGNARPTKVVFVDHPPMYHEVIDRNEPAERSSK